MHLTGKQCTFIFVVLTIGLCVVSCYSVVTVPKTVSNGLTCWTCPEKSSNQECNDWAPDVTCPENRTVCSTVHRFNTTTKKSIVILKECVLPILCTKTAVGCSLSDAGFMECVSCCVKSYCNKDIPTDLNSAIRLTSNEISKAPSRFTIAKPVLHCFIILLICIGS